MGYIQLVRRSAEQKPVVTTVKEELKPVRYYPDGEIIPATLPSLYAPATTPIGLKQVQKRCDNCQAYSPANHMCATFDAVVRPEYVCAVWQAMS